MRFRGVTRSSETMLEILPIAGFFNKFATGKPAEKHDPSIPEPPMPTTSAASVDGEDELFILTGGAESETEKAELNNEGGLPSSQRIFVENELEKVDEEDVENEHCDVAMSPLGVPGKSA